MKRKWEPFETERRRGPRKAPRVMLASVARGRIITLSADVDECLGSPVRAMFLYDHDTRAVGIRAALPAEAKRSNKVTRGLGGVTICAVAFCRHYNIPSPLYDLPVTIEDGMAVFEIPEQTNKEAT